MFIQRRLLPWFFFHVRAPSAPHTGEADQQPPQLD